MSKYFVHESSYIDDNVKIGSGDVINKDIKSFALIIEVPTKQISWVNKVGNTLEFNEKNIAIDLFDKSTYIISKEGNVYES